MLRATFKSLLARKLRLVLSALAVVLGVSFVVGALVLTNSLSRTFDTLFSDVNENIAVDVRGTEVIADAGDDVGANRQEVPADTLSKVEAVDGVASVQPSISGNAVLVGSDGKAVTTSGAPTLGVNWVDSVMNPFQITSGNAPRAPNEVVINSDLAEKAKKNVGDTAIVLTGTGQQQVKIVGLVKTKKDDKGTLGGSTLVGWETATAQRVLDVKGYTELNVEAKDGVSQETLRDRVKAVLPAGTEAITGTELADEQASDVKQFLGFFNTFLLVFAGIALFVGAFIIFNTFTILVAQRTRELALMRALGASKGQVTRSVVLEAVLVGFIASALGLGLGLGVAVGLKALFNSSGAGLPDGPTVVSSSTVIAAFAVGIIVTVLSALIPSRRAAKVAPVAAMRDAANTEKSLVKQTIGGAIVLAVGVVLLTIGLSQGEIKLVGFGALFTFLGIAVLSPLLSKPVAGVIGKLMSRRIAGKLGRENSLRNPRRTASTAAALMIGLALVSAIGVLGASVKTSLGKIVDTTLGSDFILDTEATGMTQETLDTVGKQDGVASVSGLRGEQIQLQGKTHWVTAVPASALGSAITVKQTAGNVQDLGPGKILIDEDVSTKNNWQVGTAVPVKYQDGTSERLTVAGIYETNELAGGWLLDESAVAHFKDKLYFAALVNVADGADAGTVRGELEQAIKPYPNVTLQDRSEFIGEATSQIDQLVQFLSLLLVLSVIIAVLGIVNTLALSVLERTRELGLLRAVGMSKRQIKRMVRVESVIIATFGGVLGLAVGAALGIALQQTLADEGITELSFPYGQLVIYLALAAVAGVLAALLPARRAARLNVLQAIAAD